MQLGEKAKKSGKRKRMYSDWNLADGKRELTCYKCGITTKDYCIWGLGFYPKDDRIYCEYHIGYGVDFSGCGSVFYGGGFIKRVMFFLEKIKTKLLIG